MIEHLRAFLESLTDFNIANALIWMVILSVFLLILSVVVEWFEDEALDEAHKSWLESENLTLSEIVRRNER